MVSSQQLSRLRQNESRCFPCSSSRHCMQRRPQMVEAIHYELECALDDPAAEVSRLLDMQKLIYSPLSSICAQCLEEGDLAAASVV